MKILWLCNVPLPKIAEHISEPVYNGAGWLEGCAYGILKNEHIQLSISFPIMNAKELIIGELDGIQYFGFPATKKDITKYSEKAEEMFKNIISLVRPDILHIFGTENCYSLAMINSFNVPDKTIINIQGLVSAIAEHYYSGLPFNVIHRFTIRDLIKMENIVTAKKDFENRGVCEKVALNSVDNIIGRTDWDRACATQINPNAKYYHCNESLRDAFYNNTWDINKCQKYSIFISQAMYPIKGLHFVIEAMPLILKKYPSTHLYIAGSTIRIGKKDLKNRILMTSYAKYISDLIKKHNLDDNITFTGVMGEADMCNRFLKSHVFVSASTLENESNSLSEAKILGVPTVASFVGGVTNRVRHKHDGFLYQHDAPYMLAYYICEIFSDDNLAVKFSKNGRREALEIFDKDTNAKKMCEIYKDIVIKGHFKTKEC